MFEKGGTLNLYILLIPFTAFLLFLNTLGQMMGKAALIEDNPL